MELKFQRCPFCCDFGFSSGIIAQHSGLQSAERSHQDAVRQEIQGILQDIATYTPITSDVVEIKHGQVQWSVSKRGASAVKAGPAAMETTLIQSCLKQHIWAQESVANQTLPGRATSSKILQQSGASSTNKYSSAVQGSGFVSLTDRGRR